MSTRPCSSIMSDMLKTHILDLYDDEHKGWASVGYRRHFGPLVAVILRPNDNIATAVLKILLDGNVILEKTFEPSVQYEYLLPGQPPEYRLTSAVDLARKFAEGMNYAAVASLAVAAAVDDLDATVSRLVSELKQIREILDNR